MTLTTIKSRHKGFVKGLSIVAATSMAAIIGHFLASFAGLEPLFIEGAAGGAVLGAFVYAQFKKVQKASPLVDATSADRIEFDEAKRATITHPPYEDKEYDVFAIETDPECAYPFKVWVDDGKGLNHHPFYATAVEFKEDREAWE